MRCWLPIALVLTGCAPTGPGIPAVGAGASSGVATGSPVGPGGGLSAWDGTLAQARDRILGELWAGRDTEAFVPTDAAAFDAFREIAARLAVGDLAVEALAESQDYEVLLAWDEDNQRDVAVVWERIPRDHRGALMVAIDADARPVVIESPHSTFDGMTGPEGFDLFVSLRARAWIANTVHRCANAASSPCAGTTTACGQGTEPFRESDAAHESRSAFQAWHEGLLDTDPSLVALQNHGFAHTDGEPEAFVSNGSAQPADPMALSNRLAAELDAVLPVGAVSCNLAEDAALAQLCATTNTQGRHANGAVDGCEMAPVATTDRFLHVEQSWELRNLDGPVHRGLVRDALDAVLPH